MKACLQLQPEFCSREKLLMYYKRQQNEKSTQIKYFSTAIAYRCTGDKPIGPLWYHIFLIFLHSPSWGNTSKKQAVLYDDFSSIILKANSLLWFLMLTFLHSLEISWHILSFTPVASLIWINNNQVDSIHNTLIIYIW